MVRKTVTVVFADVAGSTGIGEQLDPEALRRLMTRYFDVARTTLERHGGTVEKFIGDAVMAVFGIPAAHEDDALRAARAAVELRDADLDVTLRIGVNTGEVVAAEGETLVTGDAVNVAARLEQSAEPGEILIGDATYRLARDALRVEEVEPVEVKGKSQPVRAWRLVDVLEDAPAYTRQLDAPFVGRGEQLAQLVTAFQSAVDEQRAQLVTVLGAAGIGKSRLARELLNQLGDRARVVVGRCLAYGDGITYWPLAEIVRASAGASRDAIKTVVGDDLVADRIAAAIGVGGAIGTKEETQWAARHFLESLAEDKPLLVVLDDLHWAEATFLDLVEYVADFAAAPLLLLCTARPDLLDARPGWTAPRRNATAIVLAPLDASDAAELLAGVDAATRDRILEAAEGNPLFVEQLLALRAETNGGQLAIPPTIRALLAARIDSLAPPERAVIERASVEGRLFHRGTVTELAPEDVRPDVGAHLLALVRKEFVRPDRAQLPGDDGYRFAHILVRDAAYEAMPKELRADLHERFVDWLERVATERLSALEEIVGYHLEQTAVYRRELGLDDNGAAQRAAQQLARAGTRAFDRGDLPAARNLLGRSTSLLPAGDGLRVRTLHLLGSALFNLGELERATETLERAVDEAEQLGDRSLQAAVWAMLSTVQLTTRPDVDADAIERRLEAILPEVEQDGGPRAIVSLRRLDLMICLMRARFGEVAKAAERLLDAARSAGDLSSASEGVFFMTASYWLGPIPAEEGLRSTQIIRAQAQGPLELAAVDHRDAGLLAMRGEFDEARRLIDSVRRTYADFGMALYSSGVALAEAMIEFAADRPERAEAVMRECCDVFREIGETGYLSTNLGYLGEALYRLGRFDEAEEATRESESLTQRGDVSSEAIWRSVRAKLLARRGDDDEALRLAREAVEWIETTDGTQQIGEAYEALGEVLRFAGRPDEARAAFEHALELYEQKGHQPFAARMRTLLVALR